MRHTEVVQVRNKQRGMQMRMNQNEKRNILGMVEGDLGENVRCKGGEAIGMRGELFTLPAPSALSRRRNRWRGLLPIQWQRRKLSGTFCSHIFCTRVGDESFLLSILTLGNHVQEGGALLCIRNGR